MKYQGTEDNFQIAIARYLDARGLLWTHVANERKTSPAAGARLKRKGVKSGVPDVLIFEPRGIFSGLAIELKVGSNKPTDSQRGWLYELSERGWCTFWSNDVDAVLDVIENYLNTEL